MKSEKISRHVYPKKLVKVCIAEELCRLSVPEPFIPDSEILLSFWVCAGFIPCSGAVSFFSCFLLVMSIFKRGSKNPKSPAVTAIPPTLILA